MKRAIWAAGLTGLLALACGETDSSSEDDARCPAGLERVGDRCLPAAGDNDLEPVPGCIDGDASNFDADANTDDGSCLYDVLFQVDMSGESLGGSDVVYLRGDFNAFGATANPLSDDDTDDIWTATLSLAPGTYEYRYSINDVGSGGTDETVPAECDFVAGGDANRGFELVDTPLDLAVHEFGACATGGPGCTDDDANNYDPEATSDDGSCLYDVTFAVDMSCSGETFTTVHVTGPFCSFCGSGFDLADPDNDNIWTGTFAFAPGALEYKYIVDTFSSQENLIDDMVGGGSCAPVTDFSAFANRQITITDAPVSVSETYGSCDPCGGTVEGCTDTDASNYNPAATSDDGSCTYDVTFEVDMSCSGETFTTVHVTGPFCDFCGSGFDLTDGDGDDIWTGTFAFAPGEVEYKYIVDTFSSQEDLVDDMVGGATCAPATDFNLFANRRVTISDAPVSVSGTYGSCDPCPSGDSDILFLPFDGATTVDDWARVGNANSAEASISWADGDGNPDGALQLTGVNTEAAPKAYIFEYSTTGLDYDSATDVQLTFDLKTVGGLVGVAVQLQTNIPGPGVVNNSNLETNGLNDATWTSYTYDFTGVTGGADTFYMHFNMATGDFVDAGGTLLVDNVRLVDTTGVVFGCTDSDANNYDSSATDDDGSCTYDITFAVDMSCSGETFTSVHVTGPFCTFCGSGFDLADGDGDDIWTGTFSFPGGQLEYKYIIDVFAGEENLIDDMVGGASCAPVTDFFAFANRRIAIDGPVTLSETYGSCDPCPGGTLDIFVDALASNVSFAPFDSSVNNLSVDDQESNSGTSSYRIEVPAPGAFTGGALVASTPVDLTGYDALTFWAKASEDRSLDVTGLGDDSASGVTYRAEVLQVPLTTTWTQYVIPIPNPARLSSEDGLFHFAEGGEGAGYTIWLDDIRYETLGSSVIGTASPAIATQTLALTVGENFDVVGTAATYDVSGSPVTVSVAPAYFDYFTTDNGVASVDALGVGTADGPGSADITAELAGVAAGGTLTVNVSGGSCTPVAPELTANGGFEAGDITCWQDFSTINNGTFSATTDEANGGTWSGLLVASVPAGGGPASFPVIKQANIGVGTVTPNTTMTISFDLFGSVEGPGGVFFAEFFSEVDGGAPSASELLSGGPLFPNSTWTTYTYTPTTGTDVSGGVTLQFKADCGGNPGCTVTAYIDNVSVQVQ